MAESLRTYLTEMYRLYASGAGVAETSYYPPLHGLLASIGKELKPKVFCIQHLKNTGAGIPDFGLYAQSQLPKTKAPDAQPTGAPERGVIEAKPVAEDVTEIAGSAQVDRYLKRYGLVLVTNYRDFLLIGEDRSSTRLLEKFRLADSEEAFWDLAAHPTKAAKDIGARFVEFLTRILLHRAPLTQPKDLAWFLASYARDALARVEAAGELEALAAIRDSLEQALGFKFEGKEGEHFFRSTLVQTLFYGVFSAWVLWARHQKPGSHERFDWRSAAWSLHVPMIRTLFTALATPDRLQPLGLVEVLDWTAGALDRVDRPAFFAKFDEGQAVQYFYEPFLEAFDPELRKELGVWYTPPEIVKYMVERVDRVLRQELAIADGLADRRVYVLDPCCGTGSYLVEVLHRIARTHQAKGEKALVGAEVGRAARERVFGFEIMPAPYVVAHWQVGLMLLRLGAPLSEGTDDRAAIYLTNALTGWEPPSGPKKQLKLALPELADERDAAERVKQETPILVILGNPPYNAYAGVAPDSEHGLVDVYKAGLLKEWGIKKFNLDDLYVRFFRIAERRIAERTGEGIVAFISNYSWTSEPSFVVLRERLQGNFAKIWIENMHGNRKISEYGPDGRTSETVFAVPGFSAGIQQGVVISLWAKKRGKKGPADILYRDDINASRASDRRAQLLASLDATDFDSNYEQATPKKSNRFSFRPSEMSGRYLNWPRITDLSAIPPMNGLMEKRGGALIDIERSALQKRMQTYFDPSIDWPRLKSLGLGLTKDAARFGAEATRIKVLKEETYDVHRVRRYLVRPFDQRWCYYSTVRPLWNEPRPQLWAQLETTNECLVTRVRSSAGNEGVPMFFSRGLFDDHLIVPDAACVPLVAKSSKSAGSHKKSKAPSLFEGHESSTDEVGKANISSAAIDYLVSLAVHPPVGELIWCHALAIGYSPAYRREHADGIKDDWPRIPLPSKRSVLEASASLGRRIADLLDVDRAVEGVTDGAVRPELRGIGSAAKVGGGQLTPKDLSVTAGWGHAGKKGVTMPGKGRRGERTYTPEERAAIAAGAKALKIDDAVALTQLGSGTGDVYLNDIAYWSNIPERVWGYAIGGYQVMKKWLSYREHDLLGRALTLDEMREVTNMARRIAAILLLQPALDANYHAVSSATFSWPQG